MAMKMVKAKVLFPRPGPQGSACGPCLVCESVPNYLFIYLLGHLRLCVKVMLKLIHFINICIPFHSIDIFVDLVFVGLSLPVFFFFFFFLVRFMMFC